MPDKVTKKYLKETKVVLCNPHPGFGDPSKYLITLPPAFKQKADELDGQEIYLADLIDVFDNLVKGFWTKGYEVGIYKEYGHLSVELHEGDPYPKHMFRILNYEVVEAPNGKSG